MNPGDIPLIPRKVLFGNPDRAHVQISPDGAHLAWLAPRDGVLNVWVAPRDDPAAARPINRNPEWHDLYRIDIMTGEMTLMLQHDRFMDVTVDADYHVRYASRMSPDGGADVGDASRRHEGRARPA